MKKTHLDLKKTVIVISAAIGLSLVASTLNAAGDEKFRMKSATQPKMKPIVAPKKPIVAPKKRIVVPTRCAPGFKKGPHQLGYSCASKATCTKPFFAEKLRFEEIKVTYVCRDPNSVPK